MPEVFGSAAFSPKEIAKKVESVGVIKARLPFVPMLFLGILAGAFIGIGAMFFMIFKADGSLSFAVSSVGGGIAFSLGLFLVIVAGAELFTGNNLLVMAWADGRISTVEVLRNWAVVFTGNFIGASSFAVIVFLSGHMALNHGAVGAKYLAVAAAKCALPFWPAFFSGILCNVLVCLAVWMATAGRTIGGKTIAIVFPVTAFVAAGFEHSVANLYFFSAAALIQTFGGTGAPVVVTWAGVLGNLAPVILGNIVGGGVLVGLVYHFVYQRLRTVDLGE
jgi:formate/nitrite transporter